MSILYGNARLVFHEAHWLLVKVLFLYITLPLMVTWIIIGLIFNLTDGVVTGISGPVYINIMIFAIIGFKKQFPVAIGMGSTRVLFLKSFYLTGLGAVTFTMLLLNVCQYVLMTVYNQWIGWGNILHPAVLVRPAYQFLPYLWIDLMVGLFLFGFSFLIYCIWYRLGTARSLIILMVVAITALFLYYSGVLEMCFVWIRALKMNTLIAFTLLGAVSLAALFSTYPLMRNAPLQPAPRK